MEQYKRNLDESFLFNKQKFKNSKRSLFHGISRTSTTYDKSDDTFHKAIGSVLKIGRHFGILPLTGICEPDSTHLKFTWYSWRVGFTLISMAGSAAITSFGFLFLLIDGITIHMSPEFFFYADTFLALVLFLMLAPRWPALCMNIAAKESVRPASMRKGRSLRSRFEIWCFSILVPALMEHLLATLAGITVAHDCRQHDHTVAQSYFQNCYKHIFYFIDFSPLKGFIIQVINFESTFNWNFMDLFIITLSLGLADRFDQLNEKLDAVKGKHMPDQFWMTAREEYSHLSRLVKEVDGETNKIVFVSFANNLYFICVQLFKSFTAAARTDCLCNPVRDIAHIIYFIFSFGFLLARSLAVSLSAARIHTASLRPAAVLYAAPSSSFNSEVRRFLHQVNSDKIALTGLGLFHVTRGLVLTIVGTVVTYELVLVQFNYSQSTAGSNNTAGCILAQE